MKTVMRYTSQLNATWEPSCTFSCSSFRGFASNIYKFESYYNCIFDHSNTREIRNSELIMSLYYSLVFVFLVVEIVMFSILALPIPTKFRKPLTIIMLKPMQNDIVQVTIKCILGFILLLFVDTINKVYNIDRELMAATSANSKGGGVYSQDRIEVLSRKFFAQRNMYLTGMTLFLTFTVVRTFNLVQELLQLKDKYRKESPKYDTAADEKKNAEKKEALLKQIKEKDDEIARLKEKAQLLQSEM